MARIKRPFIETPSEKAAFVYGIQLAAEVAKDYDKYSYHSHLVSECILGKLNVTKRHPRKNPHAKKIKEALDRLDKKISSVEGTMRFMALAIPPFKVVTRTVDVGRGQKINVKEAVTPEGHYIGDPSFAEKLVSKYGISRFELRTPRSKVCSVGFSNKSKLWYGWSHRAIDSFETRAAAARFAESVS